MTIEQLLWILIAICWFGFGTLIFITMIDNKKEHTAFSKFLMIIIWPIAIPAVIFTK